MSIGVSEDSSPFWPVPRISSRPARVLSGYGVGPHNVAPSLSSACSVAHVPAEAGIVSRSKWSKQKKNNTVWSCLVVPEGGEAGGVSR